MGKKFLEINGIRIAYLEKNSEKTNAIFFLHGNSSSSFLWRKQLWSDLFAEYRLIAIDLPAHGDSDACKNPEEDYSPIATAQILAPAIKLFAGDHPYLLTGFSYGTNLIAEMLVHGLNPKGIAFTGGCVVGACYGPEKILAEPESNIFLQEKVSMDEAEFFFKRSLYTSDKDDIQHYQEDFFAVKPLFRSSLIQSVFKGKYTDEILALQKQNIPLLVVFGQNDNLVQINYLDDARLPLWKDTIFKLPGAGHFVQTDQPEIFNPLLLNYVIERFE